MDRERLSNETDMAGGLTRRRHAKRRRFTPPLTLRRLVYTDTTAPGLRLVYTWFTPGLHLVYTWFTPCSPGAPTAARGPRRPPPPRPPPPAPRPRAPRRPSPRPWRLQGPAPASWAAARSAPGTSPTRRAPLRHGQVGSGPVGEGRRRLAGGPAEGGDRHSGCCWACCSVSATTAPSPARLGLRREAPDTRLQSLGLE